MSTTTPSTPTGAQLRDQGIDAVIAADCAGHRLHREAVEQVLDRLISSGAVFSADDLRTELPQDVAEAMSPHLLGAVLRVRSVRGEIQAVDWTTSTRPERHAGPLRRWRGVTAVPTPREAS